MTVPARILAQGRAFEQIKLQQAATPEQAKTRDSDDPADG
jgi:hypothetical protein